MKILIGSEFELQTLLLKAKKEVFDDLLELMNKANLKYPETDIGYYHLVKEGIEKRHLSTFEGK